MENLAVNSLTPSFFLVGMLTHFVQEVVEVVAAYIFYLNACTDIVFVCDLQLK